ncbi:MAG: sigma-E factor regulatory protein RseB domain-containing protein [Enterobacter sp.]
MLPIRLACARRRARWHPLQLYRHGLDAETKLPLRVDLLDRDGETLEQFPRRSPSTLSGHAPAPVWKPLRSRPARCLRSCRTGAGRGHKGQLSTPGANPGSRRRASEVSSSQSPVCPLSKRPGRVAASSVPRWAV